MNTKLILTGLLSLIAVPAFGAEIAVSVQTTWSNEEIGKCVAYIDDEEPAKLRSFLQHNPEIIDQENIVYKRDNGKQAGNPMTLLAYAVEKGRAAVVEVLLECRANPNVFSFDGGTLLSAVRSCKKVRKNHFEDYEAVEKLLLRNQSPQSDEDDAELKREEEAVNFQYDQAEMCIESKRIPELDKILKQTPDLVNWIRQHPNYQTTLLRTAVEDANCKAVVCLLVNKASDCVVNGQTSLELAQERSEGFKNDIARCQQDLEEATDEEDRREIRQDISSFEEDVKIYDRIIALLAHQKKLTDQKPTDQDVIRAKIQQLEQQQVKRQPAKPAKPVVKPVVQARGVADLNATQNKINKQKNLAALAQERRERDARAAAEAREEKERMRNEFLEATKKKFKDKKPLNAQECQILEDRYHFSSRQEEIEFEKLAGKYEAPVIKQKKLNGFSTPAVSASKQKSGHKSDSKTGSTKRPATPSKLRKMHVRAAMSAQPAQAGQLPGRKYATPDERSVAQAIVAKEEEFEEFQRQSSPEADQLATRLEAQGLAQHRLQLLPQVQNPTLKERLLDIKGAVLAGQKEKKRSSRRQVHVVDAREKKEADGGTEWQDDQNRIAFEQAQQQIAKMTMDEDDGGEAAWSGVNLFAPAE